LVVQLGRPPKRSATLGYQRLRCSSDSLWSCLSFSRSVSVRCSHTLTRMNPRESTPPGKLLETLRLRVVDQGAQAADVEVDQSPGIGRRGVPTVRGAHHRLVAVAGGHALEAL